VGIFLGKREKLWNTRIKIRMKTEKTQKA